MKKLLSILLVAVMLLSLGLTAFADSTGYAITIDSKKTGHEYQAYQIFAGDLLEEKDDDGKVISSKLSNITWGSGITEAGVTALEAEIDAIIAEIEADTNATDEEKEIANPSLSKAEAYARYVATMADDSAEAKAIAENFAKYLNTCATSTEVKSGTGDDAETTGYTITGLDAGYYLVRDNDKKTLESPDAYTDLMLQVVTNVEITPKTSIPEVVKEVTDAEGESGKSADYDLGDSVPFTITADLGDIKTADYHTYYVKIFDTLPAGLTYDANSIKVMLYKDSDDTTGTDVTKNAKFEVTITEAVAATEEGGSDTPATISVVCSDVMQEGLDAVDGAKIVVTYNATLNENAVIGNPGNINKVKLEYQNDPNWKGTPSTTPPTDETPEDYSVVFTFEYIVNKVDENGDALAGAGFTLYKSVKKEVALTQEELDAREEGDDATTKTVDDWDAVGEEITGVTTFEFERLGDGTYKLEETTTPSGYNTMDPITFTISHTEKDGEDGMIKIDTLSSTDTSATTDADAGTIEQDIENRAGSILPSTGGIGTTIFYIVGGILLVGAGVVLVSRKRVDAQD